MPIRAKEHHPLVQKLGRIFQKMEDEGVRISWEDRCFVITGEDGVEWELHDLGNDDMSCFQLGPTELPPAMEYKLIHDEEG